MSAGRLKGQREGVGVGGSAVSRPGRVRSWIYGTQLLSGWQTCEELERCRFSPAAPASSSSACYCVGKDRRSPTHGECAASFSQKHAVSCCFFHNLLLRYIYMRSMTATFDLLYKFFSFFGTHVVPWLLCSLYRFGICEVFLFASCQQLYHTWPAILVYKNNFVKGHLTNEQNSTVSSGFLVVM